jgi:hypothetical protein
MRVSTSDHKILEIPNDLAIKMQTLVDISKDTNGELIPLPFVHSYALDLVLDNKCHLDPLEALLVCNYLNYPEMIDKIIYSYEFEIPDKYLKYLRPFFLKIFSSFRNVEDAREFRKGKELPEIYQDVSDNWSLDLFAKLGHEEIVKCLLKYRKFEDYKEPARLAAYNGHLNVYRMIRRDHEKEIFPRSADYFLFNRYNSKYCFRDMEWACRSNSLEYLDKHKDELNTMILVPIIRRKRIEMLDYMSKIRPDLNVWIFAAMEEMEDRINDEIRQIDVQNNRYLIRLIILLLIFLIIGYFIFDMHEFIIVGVSIITITTFFMQ